MSNYISVIGSLLNNEVIQLISYNGSYNLVQYAFSGDYLCRSVENEPWAICSFFCTLDIERIELSPIQRPLPTIKPSNSELEREEYNARRYYRELNCPTAVMLKSTREVFEVLYSNQVLVHDDKSWGVSLFTLTDNILYREGVNSKYINSRYSEDYIKGKIEYNKKGHSKYQMDLTAFYKFEKALTSESVSDLFDERIHIRNYPFKDELKKLG